MPYAERVDRAVQRLRKAHRFTDPQSKWLDRIAKQVKLETVVDRASLDAGQFKTDGGFARLNKVFDGIPTNSFASASSPRWRYPRSLRRLSTSVLRASSSTGRQRHQLGR
jgi:type I restriction enzyme R subunit